MVLEGEGVSAFWERERQHPFLNSLALFFFHQHFPLMLVYKHIAHLTNNFKESVFHMFLSSEYTNSSMHYVDPGSEKLPRALWGGYKTVLLKSATLIMLATVLKRWVWEWALCPACCCAARSVAWSCQEQDRSHKLRVQSVRDTDSE